MKKIVLMVTLISLIQKEGRAFTELDTSKKLESLPSKLTDRETLKFNLNEDDSHYFQATLLTQVWLLFNKSNPGTNLQIENIIKQQNGL